MRLTTRIDWKERALAAESQLATRIPAASPVAGVIAINFWAVVVDGRRIWCGFNEDECESVAQSRGGTVVPYVAQPSAEGDGWIAVSERLPEEFAQVLVAWASGDIDISMRNGDGWGAPIVGKPAQKAYTHWRPLPAPPVAKEGRES